MKKLIVFDLDGLVADRGSSLDVELAALLGTLLSTVKVAIISAGSWLHLARKVLVPDLRNHHCLSRLSLLPGNGSQFYRFESGWRQLYADNFSENEKIKIIQSFDILSASYGSRMATVPTEMIRDHGSHITLSLRGKRTTEDSTGNGATDLATCETMKARLNRLIPEFSVRLGPDASIDVTRPGVDKAYGIRKLHTSLGISIDKMFFVGDPLQPDRNDYRGKRPGVLSIRVQDPTKAKRVIEAIIECLDGALDPYTYTEVGH